MKAGDYKMISVWRLPASTLEVFDIIADTLSLPRWWPAVYLEVRELKPGVMHGLGRVMDQHVKGSLPYTLRWQSLVTEVEPGSSITIEARGDFLGRGRWVFEQDGEWTVATYSWHVRINKPLVRGLSFVMKPIFYANHRWAMKRGEESLVLELARRHADTAEELAHIPPPRPPTPSSLAPAFTKACTAAFGSVRRLRTRNDARWHE
jgi:uncharacterized protein YndB with AHSA1/START domain